jgi:DNA-binding response OmpR family regulator
LSVRWFRIGNASQVDQDLVREGRFRTPNLVIVLEEGGELTTIQPARESYGPVPVLAVGEEGRIAELRALAAGADTFCALPLDADLFGARVRALLRRESGAFHSARRIGIVLTPDTRTLCVDNLLVELSPTEYQIARCLYDSLDRWVSVAKLWSAIGRDDPFYDSSLLRTHTMAIRNKLGSLRWILRSERGKGMMLSAAKLKP